MTDIQTLFSVPDLHPLEIDFSEKVMIFARIPRLGYRAATFLGHRAAMRVATATVKMRLDDVLLAAALTPRHDTQVHYALHTAYCCSTLLARYFELLPSCFVLKEPQLLSQLATSPHCAEMDRFPELLDACLRLLTRTYEPGELVMIKPNVPCNFLAISLLNHSPRTTITFLFTAMRRFILAALKSELRRGRIRSWNQSAASIAGRFQKIAEINPATLNDAEAAAYSWLVNRQWFDLLRAHNPGRVISLDGDLLASTPATALNSVLPICGFRLTPGEITELVSHPAVRQHSKHSEEPYDGESRTRDMDTMDDRFRVEADGAIEWVRNLGFVEEYLETPEASSTSALAETELARLMQV